MSTIVRGSLKPDLQITIADSAADADFSAVTAADVTVICEQGGVIVAQGQPDVYTPATDKKSAMVQRAWGAGETDRPGHMWVSVKVSWPGGKPQTFPDDGPLRLDVERAAGDA